MLGNFLREIVQVTRASTPFPSRTIADGQLAWVESVAKDREAASGRKRRAAGGDVFISTLSLLVAIFKSLLGEFGEIVATFF